MTTRSRRRSRNPRITGSLPQPAWKPLRYHRPAYELLSADAIEQIHQAALKVLKETGMAILSEPARKRFSEAGFDTKSGSDMVQFDSELLESLVSKAPSSFIMHARNPDKSIQIGDGFAAFCSVGGPAYVMDSDKGRRTGNYQEM
ncbi:MAG: trimethylamine methyltransferase family protein, partial [Pseudomonadota bacterium]